MIRTVRGFPDYKISDKGTVWTRRWGYWRKLKLYEDPRNGYREITCRNGKKKKRTSVHRLVYETFVGPIPPDKEIHHDDENPRNNHVGNLLCLTDHEHRMRHRFTPAQYAHLDRIRPLTKAWHRSEAGRKVHSRISKESWKRKVPEDRVCIQCGKTYPCIMKRKTDRYCSRACIHRWNHDHKRYWYDGTCLICKRPFRSGRKTVACCSRACCEIKRRITRYGKA